MDFDGDSSVLMADFDAFLGVFNGEAPDCNANGVPNMLEILLEEVSDADQNGAPDECLFQDDLESGDSEAWSSSTG